MTSAASATPHSPAGNPGLSLAARVWGILTSPRTTFVDVVARPRWFGMMALVLVVTAVCTGGFLSTEVGQTAWMDQAVERAQQSGRHLSDAELAATEKMVPYMGIITAVSTLIIGPVMWLAMAGILFAVFNAALGGTSTFRQLFAVLVHSSVPTLLQQLIVTPLNYARESMSSATSLAVFLPMLEEGSFPAKLLRMADLFVIWWIALLAIGLGVLFRRRTGPIATGLFAVYGVIAVVLAAAF